MNFRIEPTDCQALMVDIQERLATHIAEIDMIEQKVSVLIRGLQALNIPIMLNEQYPKGLGKTLPSLAAILDANNQTVFEKTTFSVCKTSTSWQHIATQGRRSVIVFGTEAHVCVMQTVLDLLASGMQPVLIADAVGSRTHDDKKMAISRMQQAGAIITTTEAILFELCQDATNPAFKTISNLVK